MQVGAGMQAGRQAGCCCWTARQIRGVSRWEDQEVVMKMSERAGGRQVLQCLATMQSVSSGWMDGWMAAVRCAQRARRNETDRQARRDETDETMVAGRQTGQASMAVLPSRCTRPQRLPQAFEKRFRITLPAVPAALIERYGHACSSLQSRPARSTHCPIFAPSSLSCRPRAHQAISRALSPACSIDGAKWSNLVTIARSEGCHSCRPNHLHSQKKLRIFRHPCQWYGGTC